MKRSHFLIASLTAVLTIVLPGIGYAEELTVSGNGSDSENEVHVSQGNTTTVESSNNSDISNDISVSSNTGGNSASDNTGQETSITTGDVSTDVTISNSGNYSSINQSCCQSGSGSVTVSGNGAGSENTSSVANNATTSITLTNNTRITNTIYGSAVTGNNTANGNIGNTWIRTGDISVQQNVVNGPLNTNYVQVPSNINGNYSLHIYGNGSDSQNDIRFRNNASKLITTNNDVNITNTVLWDLITGNNNANWNVGDVSISTGDITSKLTIENGPINVNKVHVDCCQEKEKVTLPPTGGVTSNPPSNPGPGPSHPHGDGGRGGDVLGQAIGHILPATGTNWLFYALMGNIVMFFLGMYLRLRSGRSPGFVYSV